MITYLSISLYKIHLCYVYTAFYKGVLYLDVYMILVVWYTWLHDSVSDCKWLFQIHVSRKWGFTKWDRDDYEPMRADGRLVPDGVSVQYKPHHGPLAKWMAAQG